MSAAWHFTWHGLAKNKHSVSNDHSLSQGCKIVKCESDLQYVHDLQYIDVPILLQIVLFILLFNCFFQVFLSSRAVYVIVFNLCHNLDVTEDGNEGKVRIFLFENMLHICERLIKWSVVSLGISVCTGF